MPASRTRRSAPTRSPISSRRPAIRRSAGRRDKGFCRRDEGGDNASGRIFRTRFLRHTAYSGMCDPEYPTSGVSKIEPPSSVLGYLEDEPSGRNANKRLAKVHGIVYLSKNNSRTSCL